jgi:hypothetical protein
MVLGYSFEAHKPGKVAYQIYSGVKEFKHHVEIGEGDLHIVLNANPRAICLIIEHLRRTMCCLHSNINGLA